MKRGAIALTIIVVGIVGWLVAKRLHSSKNEFTSQELVVYAYTSFVSSWGPGPQIAKEFETLFGAKVKLIDAGESRLLLKKMEMEGDDLAADVVIGFDQFSAEEAKKFAWQKIDFGHSIKLNPSFPSEHILSGNLVAFDWAPLTFIYRKGEIEPPQSIYDLKKTIYEKTLSLIDPRTSTAGFQFLDWIVSQLGPEQAAVFLRDIDKSIFSVSPGWSAAYGLFTKKQAKLVFSYLTSPVYHWKEEKDQSYQPVTLKEALPYQIEFAGVPKKCKSCAAGAEFAKFLLSKSSQTKIMNSNYMFPVVADVIKGSDFEKLPKFKLQNTPIPTVDSISKTLDVWKALSK